MQQHATPPLHLGLMVPADQRAPHRQIGWDTPNEAMPLLLGEIGCDFLAYTAIGTDGGPVRVYVDGDAHRRRHLLLNKRATALVRHLTGAPAATVVGHAVFVGGEPTLDDMPGLAPRTYSWLDEALTAITSPDAQRAADR